METDKAGKSERMNRIRRLVGEVTAEQLRYVDSFVSAEMGLFMPVGGACFYALTPEHTHPSYMFVLNFDDQTSIKVGGRTIAASPGRIFALSPGIPHQELASDFPPRYIAIMIDKSFFERQLSFYAEKKPVQFDGEVYDAAPGLLALLKRFMVEADYSSAGPAAGADAVLHGLGIEICHAVIRGVLGVKAAEDRVSGRVEIGRVIEYIHAHMGTKLTVAKLAGIACMSPSHFAHVFKADAGKTPLAYVNEARMRRVKKLLLAGDLSIAEIALECGFGSPSYLTASFCKKYKVSPSRFKTMNS